jgi:hypothetical protein
MGNLIKFAQGKKTYAAALGFLVMGVVLALQHQTAMAIMAITAALGFGGLRSNQSVIATQLVAAIESMRPPETGLPSGADLDAVAAENKLRGTQ